VVDLDIEVTDELEAEGRARDLVRLVQNARREAGLHVADRIALRLGLPDSVRPAIETHGDDLAEQVLAVSVDFVDDDLDHRGKLAGEPVSFAFTVVPT
jgi:isoleucyl-tRNA synthetase